LALVLVLDIVFHLWYLKTPVGLPNSAFNTDVCTSPGEEKRNPYPYKTHKNIGPDVIWLLTWAALVTARPTSYILAQQTHQHSNPLAPAAMGPKGLGNALAPIAIRDDKLVNNHWHIMWLCNQPRFNAYSWQEAG
jgi:hypothetical protein